MEFDQQRLLPTVKRRCNVVVGSRDSAGSGSSDSGNFDASSSNSSTNSIAAAAAAAAAAVASMTGAAAPSIESNSRLVEPQQSSPRKHELNYQHQLFLAAPVVKSSQSKSAPATPQRSLLGDSTSDAAPISVKPLPLATAAAATTATKIPSCDCDCVWERRPSFDSLPALAPLSTLSSSLPSRGRQPRVQATRQQQQQRQPWRQPAQRRVGQLRALLAAERRQRSCSPNGSGSNATKKVVTFSANNEIIGVADNIDRLPYLSTNASSSKPGDRSEDNYDLPPELANRLDSLSFYDNYLPQVRPSDCGSSKGRRQSKRSAVATDDLREDAEQQTLLTLV